VKRAGLRDARGERPWPIIYVYAAADLFPAGTDRVLAEELTGALLRAEGVTTPSPLHLDNTAAYVHRLPATGVHRPDLRRPFANRAHLGAPHRAGGRRLGH
jgi:hypothetical protein